MWWALDLPSDLLAMLAKDLLFIIFDDFTKSLHIAASPYLGR